LVVNTARRQIALQEPDVVLLDLVLPDGNGIELLPDIRALPASEVVLITGYASVETSVQALRMGAADYLVKPLNIKQLRGVLSRVRRPSTLRADVERMQAMLETEGHFGLLWGRSAAMRRIHHDSSPVGSFRTMDSVGPSCAGA
jgi:DNA-binding NtrC family response regulator